MMRTEITRTLGGREVFCALPVSALIEIADHRDDFDAVMTRCARGNVLDILAVLKAALAAGGVPRASAAAEARRLVEDAGLLTCGELCVDLMVHAFQKADSVLDFQSAEGDQGASPSAEPT